MQFCKKFPKAKSSFLLVWGGKIMVFHFATIELNCVSGFNAAKPARRILLFYCCEYNIRHLHLYLGSVAKQTS